MKIIKKLRDVTKEEFKEWCKNNCTAKACSQCLFCNVECETSHNSCWVKHKDLYSDKFLDQTIEVETPEILTEEEKEYLSAVIKPFRERVVFIKKSESHYYGQYVISIYYSNGTEYPDSMKLPDFDKDKKYKGMKLQEPYKLKELEL